MLQANLAAEVALSHRDLIPDGHPFASIEHTPARDPRQGDRYDRVVFDTYRVAYRTSGGRRLYPTAARNPRWTPVAAETIEAMIGESLAETISRLLIPLGHTGACTAGVDEAPTGVRAFGLRDNPPMTAEELRQRRWAIGLSLRRFARLLDVNAGTLSNWERGANPVPGWLEERLAEIERTRWPKRDERHG